jgi:hypothetical protein
VRLFFCIWISVGIVFACLTGCSTDDPVVPTNPMISDLGQFVRTHDYDDGSYNEYVYKRVSFEGDILLSEYEDGLALVAGEFGMDETVILVENYREFPPSLLGASPPNRFALFTCADANFDSCNGGRVYTIVVEADWNSLSFIDTYRS